MSDENERDDDDLLAPPRRGGRAGPDRAVHPAPRAAAADDPAPPRPAAARAHRLVRRAPGRLSRGRPPGAGIPRPADHAAVPLASLPDRPDAPGPAPPSPESPHAGRRPGSVAPPPRDAAGELGLAGRDAPGPAHLADPRRPPRRDATEAPGDAQRHGAARPRGPGPAPFRGAEQRRGRAGAGPVEDRGEQPLHPRPGAAQGDAQGHARISSTTRAKRAPRPSSREPHRDRRDHGQRRNPHRGSIRSTSSPRSTCAAAGAASAPPPPSTPRDTPSMPRGSSSSSRPSS